MSLSLPKPSSPSLEGEIVIRPMRVEDLGIVHQIDCLSFSLPWPANAFRYELMENKNSRLWVAEFVGGENMTWVVGAIVVWLVVDEAHIATLAVHPDYRRRGIATQLLQTALQECARLGMRTATLEVRAGNLAAQNLYRRFGFEVVGRRRAYYQDNHEDALIMTLSHLQTP
ncbi:MAG: Ribosomal-protein-S18p-alanine acetyltransferase [Anaerolineae bacterium]|nr:MAG: Ribosomal-protein-S18p-alanine acetyltransferase [Anaerolineae bacterium]